MHKKSIIRITEQDLHNIVNECVNRILSEGESWIDKMIRDRWEKFGNSKLKPIFDNLGLKRGKGGFTIGGDSGYISFKLDNKNIEFREYGNGKVFVLFGYDDKVGAWGGYTRKYEITNPDIFKTPQWLSIIKKNSVPTSPDVFMK